MPNGIDKNWIRLCFVIDGFRAKHRSWPSKIRLSEIIFDDLSNFLFTPESFSKIEEKLSFIVDEATSLAAEDEKGRKFGYENIGSQIQEPDIDAETWLGIEPDFLEEPEDITILFPSDKKRF